MEKNAAETSTGSRVIAANYKEEIQVLLFPQSE